MALPFSEEEEKALLATLRRRRSKVDHLVEVADMICNKLESGRSGTNQDHETLRAAIDAVRSQTFIGS